MRCTMLYRCLAALTLALALTPCSSSAQQDDTLSISGAFRLDALTQDEVGSDLVGIFGGGDDYGWTLTLYGVTYSHDSYDRKSFTRVHATAFDFEFFGPEDDSLNEIMSAQLTRGMLTDGAFLELWNGDTYYDAYGDFIYSDTYGGWRLGLAPDEGPGIAFDCGGFSLDFGPFLTDIDGYPIVEPQRVFSLFSTIYDNRVWGNSGWVESHYDLVDIGSNEPPMPPPPPPLPTLSIADVAAQEGNRGSTRLDLSVTLSGSTAEAVTVHYATADGNAVAKQDYTAASGTVTIPPGQLSGRISIAIKADRKREPNETFSVQLSNAVGATIDDGQATATILNDD